MTPATLLRILALALAGLLYAVPARATTTADALDLLCPGHRELAPHVDAAARRYLHHGVTLVALMAHESGCRMEAVGKAGERCAYQVHGVARNGRSNAELADPAICIATGARWLALMQADCNGSLVCALGAYNTGKPGKGKGYARRVLAKVAKFWGEMRRRKEPVS